MKKLICCAAFLFLSINIFADSYRQITLQNRSAASLEARLSSISGDDVSIVADGNKLILRGPQADLKQLAAIIQKLDKPLSHLKVTIYRGDKLLLGNDKSKNQSWSTNKEAENRLDTTIVEENSALFITQNELLVLPISRYYQGREGYLYNDSDILSSDISSRSRYEQNSYKSIQHGIELTPSLLAGEKVSITAIFVSPSPTKDSIEKHDNSVIYTTQEVSISRTVPLGEWVRLSTSEKHGNAIQLNNKKHVFSTRKSSEFNHTVWAKFERVKQ
jgi:hypothetical protein